MKGGDVKLAYESFKDLNDLGKHVLQGGTRDKEENFEIDDMRKHF